MQKFILFIEIIVALNVFSASGSSDSDIQRTGRNEQIASFVLPDSEKVYIAFKSEECFRFHWRMGRRHDEIEFTLQVGRYSETESRIRSCQEDEWVHMEITKKKSQGNSKSEDKLEMLDTTKGRTLMITSKYPMLWSLPGNQETRESEQEMTSNPNKDDEGKTLIFIKLPGLSFEASVYVEETLGGLLLLAVAILVAFYCYRKKKKSKKNPQSQPILSP